MDGEIMKKKICMIVIGMIVLSLIYLQWGRDVEVCNTQLRTSGGYYKQNITVIANKMWIGNREKFGHDMIQKCIDNSFDKIRFSSDLQCPNELVIQVYTNKIGYSIGEPDFVVHFKNKEKDGKYNILDNQEKFEMIIEE